MSIARDDEVRLVGGVVGVDIVRSQVTTRCRFSIDEAREIDCPVEPRGIVTHLPLKLGRFRMVRADDGEDLE